MPLHPPSFFLLSQSSPRIDEPVSGDAISKFRSLFMRASERVSVSLGEYFHPLFPLFPLSVFFSFLRFRNWTVVAKFPFLRNKRRDCLPSFPLSLSLSLLWIWSGQKDESLWRRVVKALTAYSFPPSLLPRISIATSCDIHTRVTVCCVPLYLRNVTTMGEDSHKGWLNLLNACCW